MKLFQLFKKCLFGVGVFGGIISVIMNIVFVLIFITSLTNSMKHKDNNKIIIKSSSEESKE